MGDPGSSANHGYGFTAVYGALRDAILTGEIEPGTVTTQAALAARYSVGRTPLREALRVLQLERLVRNAPNRRVQITELTALDAEELYISRVLLDSAALRVTVPTLTSRDDAEMLGFLAQMDHFGRGRDWAGLRFPHREFHARLCAAAGERIVNLIGALFDHAERYRLAETPTREHWMRRQEEHRAIAGAAARRDADGAVEILVAHYARTSAMVCHELARDNDLERLRAILRQVSSSAEAVLDSELCARRGLSAKAPSG